MSVIGHALESIDWREAHEWVLLALVLAGSVAIVLWSIRLVRFTARWTAARTSTRRERRRQEAAALTEAINRLAALIEAERKERA